VHIRETGESCLLWLVITQTTCQNRLSSWHLAVTWLTVLVFDMQRKLTASVNKNIQNHMTYPCRL